MDDQRFPTTDRDGSVVVVAVSLGEVLLIDPSLYHQVNPSAGGWVCPGCNGAQHDDRDAAGLCAACFPEVVSNEDDEEE